jgi:hypothetical protein
MTDKNSFDFDSMGRAAYLWADLEEKTYPTKPKYQVRVFFSLEMAAQKSTGLHISEASQYLSLTCQGNVIS